jgi:hypothetical protein
MKEIRGIVVQPGETIEVYIPGPQSSVDPDGIAGGLSVLLYASETRDLFASSGSFKGVVTYCDTPENVLRLQKLIALAEERSGRNKPDC